ncbi:ribonuclease HII [Butyrivibrio sp. FC2001]|uniref:ribonuclease HII n=1 Tax=Butyrivibrio sp. FC2001 TaxID=1280671 RepID=UPI00040ADC15|nr:ribonuclease HII [Butyrivibrio sp. FC2001]
MAEKIGDIKAELQSIGDTEGYQLFCEKYEADSRAGVVKLVESAKKHITAIENEKQRLYEMRAYERLHADKKYICGIDEVGRGPLAGPVYAAAVILPADAEIFYINDSKKLSEKKREELYQEIYDKAISVGIGCSDHNRIDEINILQATYEAMAKAVANLSVKPDVLLIDAVHIPQLEEYQQESIIKGDAKSVSIAAASIIAKVTRDRLMAELDDKYPGYGFAHNKGYGSADHIEALKKNGPCEIHRRSFIKNFCN